MDVAISGDRGSCLSEQLAAETYVFAVAHGFGRVDGDPIARAALARLHSEFERRARHDRFRRAQLRPKAITSAIVSAFSRVNEELHARSASHEDYVTAGCSLTAALLVNDRAYLGHVGSTAAYLARDGHVVSLTKSDAFEEDGLAVLVRAVGAQPSVEVSVCSFALNAGDALVLAGRQLREADDRRRMAEALAQGAETLPGADQLLVMRYEAPQEGDAGDAQEAHPVRAFAVGVLATIAFYTLLCIR